MSEHKEFSEIIQTVTEKSLRLITNCHQNPSAIKLILERFLDLSQDFQSLLTIILNNPEQLWRMQVAYWQDATSLFQDQLINWIDGGTTPIEDKRFSAEEWQSNPWFGILSQQYLLASEHVQSLLEHIEYGDENLAKRVKFFARQYWDALSPANFLYTNPQVLAETIQSHGKNLLLGLQNLLTDLEAGPSRLIITMTDTNAFKVGDNIATTPGNVIFRNDLIELIQYKPKTEKVYSVPMLIIPPWINKYYILDLSPHNSLISWLLSQGISVFTISWVNPDEKYAQSSLFDYLDRGALTAIDVIKKQMNVKKVNTAGFCLGGTLLAMVIAYCKKINKDHIKSATFLASLLDFEDPGDISVFIDEQQVTAVEKKMEEKGYLEGHFMASAFNSLRANDLIWSFFIKNYLQGKAHVPFDILFWNADYTNMPSKMHSQYLRWMYLQNDLIKPNKIKLNGVPIDLNLIDIPTYFVSTKKDHIAPWQSTYAGFQKMKGKKEFILGGSGHIAGIINSPDSGKYGYYLNKKYPNSPDKWFSDAKKYSNCSWWTEWLKWLKKESGKLVTPKQESEYPYKKIMDAPGSYVHQKN